MVTTADVSYDSNDARAIFTVILSAVQRHVRVHFGSFERKSVSARTVPVCHLMVSTSIIHVITWIIDYSFTNPEGMEG